MSTVIIFGPTGHVGSTAARTAAEHGAKVVLAMRDTAKDIPGLSKEDEKAGKFSRVKADLHDPSSLHEAVTSTGAKRAFFYLAHGNKDHMESAVRTMKTAGIEFVVFLSSFTVGDRVVTEVPSTEVIPYMHAMVEATLDRVFGDDHYVALRPGAFATNILRYKEGLASGKVRMYGGTFEQDGITSDDMGRTAGTILAKGPKNGQKKVYLYGPTILSLHDAVLETASILGREVKIEDYSAEEEKERLLDTGIPPVFADYMTRVYGNSGRDTRSRHFANYDEGLANVELYTGRPSTEFKEWVEGHKALFV